MVNLTNEEHHQLCELARRAATAEACSAEAQAKLKSALNEVDDDVTRLQWLQSMITMVTADLEVVSGGDIDAGLTCVSEVQALHDDLKKLVSSEAQANQPTEGVPS